MASIVPNGGTLSGNASAISLCKLAQSAARYSRAILHDRNDGMPLMPQRQRSQEVRA